MDHRFAIFDVVKNLPFLLLGQVGRVSDKVPKWFHTVVGAAILAILPAAATLAMNWLTIHDDLLDMKSKIKIIMPDIKDIKDNLKNNSDRILILETHEKDVDLRHKLQLKGN